MVFNDMTDNMLFLCNQGVDIIRLDAVPYIWKSLGTNCRNLPQVHSLVRMMRMACEIVCPGTLLLGEVVMAPDKVVPYFGSVYKPECHLLYNVTTMASIWHTVATRDVRLLRNQLEQVFALPGQYTFLNYLRCHDDIGWGLDYDFLERFGQSEIPHKKYLNDYLTGKWPGSSARGELYNDDPRLGDARLCGTTASLCGVQAALANGDARALDQALTLDIALHALIFTLSGVPVLYSGDEIARLNDDAYRDDPLKAGDSRYLHRGDMDWSAAGRRADASTPEGRMFEAIRRLESLRAEHAAFGVDAAVRLMDSVDDSLLGIERRAKGERLIALFNFSEWPKPAGIGGGGSLLDLWTGNRVRAEGLTVPAGGFLWLLDADAED
jgi:amylosucrase